MIPILLAGAVGLVVSMVGTPMLITFLRRKGFGQFIRDDGPTSHHTKRGTPTMGGIVIIVAAILGYTAAHLFAHRGPSVSAVLVLFLMSGLGLVGFLDDFLKIRHSRSEGLTPIGKLAGQAVVATVFAILALQFEDGHGNTPASPAISIFRDSKLDFAVWGGVAALIIFIVWANFLVAAWSNAVNLTDGLDGLASGASIVFFLSYILICLWQAARACSAVTADLCYNVRDPSDVAVVAAAIIGACIGFLWFNTSPARIFMGDTGSLALGGAVAGMTIVTRTEVLGAVIGGLFVIIAASVVIQVVSFKTTGRRVFRMAPLQHHFELKGWNEVTIVVRFWIIAGISAAIGLCLFYAEVLPEIL